VVQTDARGVPLGVAIAGANRNDFKLLREVLESIVVPRPDPEKVEQNECLDKGFDYPEVYALLEEFGYTAHVRARGEEAQELKRNTRKKARRWVAERIHSWLNRFRRILIRWEKKPENYLGMLHLALGIITWRFVRRLSG
jgi:transposase